MKQILLIIISMTIFFFIFNSNKTHIKEETIINKKESIQKPKKNENYLLKKELIEIYDFEYIYLFLYSKYQTRFEYDKPFSKYLKKIIKTKEKTIRKLEELIKKNNIKIDKPNLNYDLSIKTTNKNANKLYLKLKNIKNKKEVYRILCITMNSTIYKINKIKNKERNIYNKFFYEYVSSINIKQLISINKTINKIGLKSCCSLSGVLCKKEKKINYENINNFIFDDKCEEKPFTMNKDFLHKKEQSS